MRWTLQARAAAEQAAEQLGAVHAAADAAQRRFEGQLQAAEVAAGEERREMLAVAEELHTRMQVRPDASSAKERPPIDPNNVKLSTLTQSGFWPSRFVSNISRTPLLAGILLLTATVLAGGRAPEGSRCR